MKIKIIFMYMYIDEVQKQMMSIFKPWNIFKLKKEGIIKIFPNLSSSSHRKINFMEFSCLNYSTILRYHLSKNFLIQYIDIIVSHPFPDKVH